jgi:hypothetical protein
LALSRWQLAGAHRVYVGKVDVTDVVHSTHIDAPVIQTRIAQLKSEWGWWARWGLSHDQVKGLALLYTKGCLANKRPERRVSDFKDVLKDRQQWVRLLHLVEHRRDRSHATVAEAGWQTWTDFCGLPGMAVWATTPTVFFNQYDGALAQRRQLLGSRFACFEQASVVVGLYAMWKNRVARGLDPCHKQVDLTALMLQHRSAETMWSFVDSDIGGSSLESVPSLTGTPFRDVHSILSRVLSFGELQAHLDRYVRCCLQQTDVWETVCLCTRTTMYVVV